MISSDGLHYLHHTEMAEENVNGGGVQGEGNENGSVPEVELIIKVGKIKWIYKSQH